MAGSVSCVYLGGRVNLTFVLSLAIEVPFCCCRNSVVKLLNMEWIKGNFLVAVSRGDHSIPLWHRSIMSSNEGWSGASHTLSSEYSEWACLTMVSS